MVDIKHNFSELNSTTNAFWGGMVEVNNATSGFLVYSLLTFFFIVSTYIMIQRTQDIGKSLVTSLHFIVIMSIILFYAGKVGGVDFVPSILVLGLLVLDAFSIAGIKFMRSQGT